MTERTIRTPERRYIVQYERVDVWQATVVAHSKKEAIEKLRDGDKTEDEFDFYGGDRKVLEVRRAEEWE